MALGVVVWPMVELEADDALASAAAVAAADPSVGRVIICTPDKDLAQCVIGDRVVQLDRRSGTVSGEDGVWAKFGVAPRSIPDWLALVGDSADGFPGLAGWGKRSASVVLAHYGSFDEVPDQVADWDPDVRQSVRGAAKLAERLADRARAGRAVPGAGHPAAGSDLARQRGLTAWRGPTDEFEAVCRHFRDPGLAERAAAVAARWSTSGQPVPKTSANSVGHRGVELGVGARLRAPGRAATGRTTWRAGTGRPGGGRRPPRPPARGAGAPSSDPCRRSTGSGPRGPAPRAPSASQGCPVGAPAR